MLRNSNNSCLTNPKEGEGIKQTGTNREDVLYLLIKSLFLLLSMGQQKIRLCYLSLMSLQMFARKYLKITVREGKKGEPKEEEGRRGKEKGGVGWVGIGFLSMKQQKIRRC